MKYTLPLFAVALLFVIGMAAPANAAGTDIKIGANLLNYGLYKDNYDFDDDTPDATAAMTTKIKVFLYNSYTDNVKTTVRFDASTTDSTKADVKLNRAFIEIKEFLNDGVTLKVGKLSWTWNFRANWGAGAYVNIVPSDMDVAFVVVTPVGFELKYAFGKTNSMTFAWGKIKEASVAGNNANDIDAMWVRYDQKLEDGKIFVAFVYYNDNFDAAVSTLPGDVWYLNFGIDYFMMEQALNLYMEFSYQDGDTHDNNFEMGAFAFNLGAEYTFKDSEVVPYIGLDITYYQGVDGNTYAYTRYLPNFNRTLIAESDFFGRIWKSNWNASGMYAGGVADPMYRGGYTGIKVLTGMKSLMNDKAALDVILGFFSANGDMPAAGIDKGLGWEIDIVFAYFYTEDVTFSFGIGYFDPNEDLGGADPDAVMMAVFGCSVIF